MASVRCGINDRRMITTYMDWQLDYLRTTVPCPVASKDFLRIILDLNVGKWWSSLIQELETTANMDIRNTFESVYSVTYNVANIKWPYAPREAATKGRLQIELSGLNRVSLPIPTFKDKKVSINWDTLPEHLQLWLHKRLKLEQEISFASDALHNVLTEGNVYGFNTWGQIRRHWAELLTFVPSGVSARLQDTVARTDVSGFKDFERNYVKSGYVLIANKLLAQAQMCIPDKDKPSMSSSRYCRRPTANEDIALSVRC